MWGLFYVDYTAEFAFAVSLHRRGALSHAQKPGFGGEGWLRWLTALAGWLNCGTSKIRSGGTEDTPQAHNFRLRGLQTAVWGCTERGVDGFLDVVVDFAYGH